MCGVALYFEVSFPHRKSLSIHRGTRMTSTLVIHCKNLKLLKSNFVQVLKYSDGSRAAQCVNPFLAMLRDSRS